VTRKEFTQLPGLGTCEPVEIIAATRDTLRDMARPARRERRLG